MRVEQAAQDDVEVVARLSVAIHDLHRQLAPGYYRPASLAEVITEFRTVLSETDAYVLLAWEGEEAIGYCALKIIERAPNAWTTGFRRLLIDQLSVEPQWRRRGIGTKLMEAAFEFARNQGIREVMLEYWWNNDAAREFYRALGFEPLTEKVLIALPDEGH